MAAVLCFGLHERERRVGEHRVIPVGQESVATLIDNEANANNAAAQLGHSSKEITKKHYIVKPALAPDSSHILEQLGASPTTTGPERGDHGPSRAA